MSSSSGNDISQNGNSDFNFDLDLLNIVKVETIELDSESVNHNGDQDFEFNFDFEKDSENDTVNMKIVVKEQFEYTPTKQHRKCKSCPQTYSTNTSSTNLKRHMQLAHPEQVYTARAPTFKMLCGTRKLTAHENFQMNKLILDMFEAERLSLDLMESDSFKDIILYLNKHAEIWDKKKAIRYISMNARRYPVLLVKLAEEQGSAFTQAPIPTMTELVDLSKRNKRFRRSQH